MGHGDTRRIRSIATSTVLCIALLGSIAACSGAEAGDDSGGTTTTTTSGRAAPDETALATAARAYNSATLDAAADEHAATIAHGYLVDSCKAVYSVTDMHAGLVDGVEARRIDLGPAAEELTVGGITVAEMTSFDGQVLVRIVTPDDDDPLRWGVPMRQHWLVEDGEWRIDMCTEPTTVDGRADQLDRVEVIASGMHQMNGEDRWAANWAAVVRNPNPEAAAYDVEVTAEFFDADGERVESIDATIVDIEPGTSGAVAGVADAPGAVRVEVRARVGSWMPVEDQEPVHLDGGVTGTELEQPMAANMTPSTHISGTVTNPSNVDLGSWVTVVFLDAAGAVRGGAQELFTVNGYIPPGGTILWQATSPQDLPDDWTFHAYVTPLAPDYTDYSDLDALDALDDLDDLDDQGDAG